MRRLLIILALCSPCFATAPVYVQSGSNGTNSNTAVVTCSTIGGAGGCTANITPGDLVVIYTRVNVNNATVGFISSQGDSFATDASCFNWPNGFSSNTMQISWIVAAVGGSTTITATWSGSNFNFLVVAEYSGAKATSPFDGCNFSNVSSGPILATITTTAADDLTIGTYTNIAGNSSTIIVTSGYTSRQMANSGSTIFDEFWDNTNLKAAGSTTFTVNTGGSVEIAAFKSASPTPPAGKHQAIVVGNQ